MSRHRFRFVGERVGDGLWRLSPGEAHHVNVLRLGSGALVEVTDGAGRWGSGALVVLSKGEVRVEVAEERVDPRPPYAINLAVGTLRPGAIDEVLPGMVELGVDHIRVFGLDGTSRTRMAPGAVERWRRVILGAVKQSKRSYSPPIDVYDTVDELVEVLGDSPSRRVLLDAGASEPLYDLLTAGASRPIDVEMVVGGEKGLTETEIERFSGAGFRKAFLGPFVLRAVTAVGAATAVAASLRARGGHC